MKVYNVSITWYFKGRYPAGYDARITAPSSRSAIAKALLEAKKKKELDGWRETPGADMSIRLTVVGPVNAVD